uniref:Uncharacterized protein n=1 Tax=Rhizophora mucronata TaxID=61149 RepID=A0A2P2QWI2_RHIMU
MKVHFLQDQDIMGRRPRLRFFDRR